MPQKGVIEKAEKTAGDFLWMPDVASPLYDMLKSLSQTAKIVAGLLIGGFMLFVFFTIFLELRKLPLPPFMALVGAGVLVVVATSVVLIIVVAIGYAFSPVTLFGVPIFRAYPNTCPPTHPELHGLLCYKPCPSGRHRVSDVCWADTQDIGPGTPVGLEPCPDGWETWPLTCRRPIRCDPIDTSRLPWTGGACRGGETIGRLDNGGVCPGPQDAGGLPGFDDWYKRWRAASGKKPRTKKRCSEPPGAHENERSCEEQTLVEKAAHVEKIDGLCYKSCPSGMTHVPLMPYLCVKTESGGKPMRLDYYDADSKIPSLVQLFGRINPF